MFDLDSWQEILGTMRANALRTALTAIGVFWGVLMLIVMVGFGNGLQGGVEKEWGGMATNSIFVWGDRTALPYKGTAPGRFVLLTRADGLALEATIPEIAAVAPRAYLNGRNGSDIASRGSKSGTFNISGDVPAYARIQPINLVSGRFLDELDIERRRKVAVIGNHVADILFPGEDPIGKTIRIKSSEFVVVGISRPTLTGDRGDRLANCVYTPLTTFLQALRPEPWVNNFAVLMKPGVESQDVEKRIRVALLRRHNISPDDKQAIGTWNAEEEFKKTTNLFKGISLLIWIVGSVTLLAGIVGVSNIMMISVRERTREIGIRRAIGATPWSVIAQVLKESTALTGLAGYLGLAGGVGVLEAVRAVMKSAGAAAPSMFEPPKADFRVAVAATIVVVLGGAIAGLFPAIYAVRVRPVVALRDE
jgi:putative ABC transport system permease protein